MWRVREKAVTRAATRHLLATSVLTYGHRSSVTLLQCTAALLALAWQPDPAALAPLYKQALAERPEPPEEQLGLFG